VKRAKTIKQAPKGNVYSQAAEFEKKA
jgi:hypothetical protein